MREKERENLKTKSLKFCLNTEKVDFIYSSDFLNET